MYHLKVCDLKASKEGLIFPEQLVSNQPAQTADQQPSFLLPQLSQAVDFWTKM